MKSKITKDQIKNIAHLAKIRIEDDELDKYQLEMSSILKYVEQLSEIDTSEVEETSQITNITNRFREDKPESLLNTKDALSNAPQSIGPYIKIPRNRTY